MEGAQEQQTAPGRGASTQAGALPVAAAWVTLILVNLTAWLILPESYPVPLDRYGLTRDTALAWLRALAPVELGLLLGMERFRAFLWRGVCWAVTGLFRILARYVRIVDEPVDETYPPAPDQPYRGREGLPPLSLLDTPAGVGHQGQDEPARLAERLPGALAALGVTGVEVVEAKAGPQAAVITVRLPAEVRASTLTALSPDLAVALGVDSLRVAGVQGRPGCVNFELPLSRRRIVPLIELIPAASEVAQNDVPLMVGLRVDGAPLIARFGQAAHALVAGETGAGKSIYLHTLITTLLMVRGPEDLRLGLADPKQVELSLYDGVPHLMQPVITDAAEVVACLAELVQEMERRYLFFRRSRVRDIFGYNAQAEQRDRLPHIVFVVDEFADLILLGKEIKEGLETQISRLSAKARAAGIHVVLATQRPTVNVVTGLIKANLPTRIAFSVASETDSRTILDQSGAETLTGRGDGLASVAGRRAVRFQSAYLDEKTAERVVQWWRARGEQAAGLQPPPAALKIVLPEPPSEGPAAQENGPLYPEPNPDTDKALPAVRLVRWWIAETGDTSQTRVRQALGLSGVEADQAFKLLDQEGWTRSSGPRRPRLCLVSAAGRQAFLSDYPPDEEYRRLLALIPGKS